MANVENIADSYEFNLIGADKAPFKGYVSSIDPTNCEPEIFIQNSKNVYKKRSGTLANRPGLLRRGTVDATNAGVVSSFEWETSFGSTFPLRVVNGNLQFESSIADGITLIWYTLLAGITLPRYVFDLWWDSVAAKDLLLGVHGDSSMLSWSGGVAKIASATAPAAGTVNVIAVNAGGSGYLVGDTLTIVGGNNNATLLVTSTDNSGKVLTVQITNPGSGYSPGIGQATTTNSQFGASGATINITTVVTAGTITISGTKAWAQMGFDASGTVTINGHTYAYTAGASGQTLYGVTPDPSGEPSGSVAIQPVFIHTVPANANPNTLGFPFQGFICDFLKVIGNRVHLGSYSSREIPISSSTSYIDFTVPSPRSTGDPELLILDNLAKGISVSKGDAFISAGTKDWYEISYTQLTVSNVATEQTKVDKKPTAALSAALSHEFIDTVGDDIVYLAQDQQVRVLGTFRNLNNEKIPSISQEIYDEIGGETFISGFTVGQLRAVGDFIYLISPISGRAYIRETRETVDEIGNVVAERLWYAPFEWSASRIAVVNDVTYVHSNANPQIYQVWDTNQWHDDSPSGSIAYDSGFQMAYRSYGRRQGMWFCNRIYAEGYTTEGTKLTSGHFVEFEGGRTYQEVILNSPQKSAKFFSSANAASLGDDSLGDNPLGDGLDTLGIGQQSLPKFKVIRKLNPANFTEHSLSVFSSGLDDQWEILCLGTNVTLNREQQAGFLST